MEQVHWKKKALLVARVLGGLAIIGTGYFYVNKVIDDYTVPFFVDNFSNKALQNNVRTEKKGLSSLFKRKKNNMRPAKDMKEAAGIEAPIQRELFLSIGMKVCIGIMLLLVSFLINFFYLGIESILIGWLLLVQAGYEAYRWYDFGELMRYKDLMLYGFLTGVTFILVIFLVEYLRTYKHRRY